jgi:hypothetical protein
MEQDHFARTWSCLALRSWYLSFDRVQKTICFTLRILPVYYQYIASILPVYGIHNGACQVLENDLSSSEN